MLRVAPDCTVVGACNIPLSSDHAPEVTSASNVPSTCCFDGNSLLHSKCERYRTQ